MFLFFPSSNLSFRFEERKIDLESLFDISFKANYFFDDIFLIMPLKCHRKMPIQSCTVNLESLERPPTVLTGFEGFTTEAHL